MERVGIIGELLADRSDGVEIDIADDPIDLTMGLLGGHSLGRGVGDRHDYSIHVGSVEKSQLPMLRRGKQVMVKVIIR